MRLYGHRGARARQPENSLEGVAWALDNGADGIEMDVRRSAEGGLFCSHDPDLRRLGGPRDPLVRLADDQVRRIILPGAFAVPTLDAVLDLAEGRGRVVIEIKNRLGEPDYDPLHCRTAHNVGLLLSSRQAQGKRDDIVVSSFDPRSLHKVREIHAPARTALLSGWRISAEQTLADVLREHHHEAHLHYSKLLRAPQVVLRAASDGIPIVSWTVNSLRVARYLRRLGVSALITDDPPLLRSSLSPAKTP